MNTYVVVQNAGCTNEKTVHEARTYDDAYCAMHEMYQPDEQEERHVDIMRRLENGDLTTEF